MTIQTWTTSMKTLLTIRRLNPRISLRIEVGVYSRGSSALLTHQSIHKLEAESLSQEGGFQNDYFLFSVISDLYRRNKSRGSRVKGYNPTQAQLAYKQWASRNRKVAARIRRRTAGLNSDPRVS
jgi:hypothetical protein